VDKCVGSLSKRRCYSFRVLKTRQPLARWKGVRPPSPLILRGRYVTLEPLDAAQHTADLWAGIKNHPELWTYFGEGPFRSQATFRHMLEIRIQNPAFVFFAIVPKKTGKVAGYASYMRIDPVHGVVEVGNVLFSPGLKRTRTR
jgi:RimJ/RimL family protein N-acetyltransferase